MTGSFTNPVYLENFPDPGVVSADGTWYAYGTNNATANVPLLTSTDLVHWTEAGDALPEVGRWAVRGNTWAPEVVRTAAGKYVLYYTARWARADRQCIGAAVSDTPYGPFTDASDEPLICQDDEGGSIDASPYTHTDGTLYLYWKNDGNHIGAPTHLYGQRLTVDGLALTGERTRLLTNDKPWQVHVIEAPQMVRHDDRLYLFYSANAFDSDAYAVGYATCQTPLGPCADAAENPILKSTPAAAGPGHSYLITLANGSNWLLYHAWPPDAVGSISPGRQLWLDPVDWVDGRPVVHGPTATPQATPGE
ncbi:glycoside hydrolase family 43 protein [Actinoplanes sp. NPDC049802]|uniref:glycoside hydrolase family 43 protein n=1 Tax=Actinoplanes sp. NPDC049802 TaxID=3154742 RepID=UPI0034093F9C